MTCQHEWETGECCSGPWKRCWKCDSDGLPAVDNPPSSRNVIATDTPSALREKTK